MEWSQANGSLPAAMRRVWFLLKLPAPMKRVAAVAVCVGMGLLACERAGVDVEAPRAGRALSQVERDEMHAIAEATLREVRAKVQGLPPRVTLVVRWGKDVIPKTRENGTAAFPGMIAWTVDPERDVLGTIRSQLRATLVHEPHHLAHARRVSSSRVIVVHREHRGLSTRNRLEDGRHLGTTTASEPRGLFSAKFHAESSMRRAVGPCARISSPRVRERSVRSAP